MSRVFITGSSTGLGLMAGRLLAEQGHEVVLHARDERRAADARTALYRLQNSMNWHIYYRRMRSMGELFSEFEV